MAGSSGVFVDGIDGAYLENHKRYRFSMVN